MPMLIFCDDTSIKFESMAIMVFNLDGIVIVTRYFNGFKKHNSIISLSLISQNFIWSSAFGDVIGLLQIIFL